MNRKPPNADSIQGLKSSREHDVRSFPVNFPVSREMVGTIVKSVVGGSGIEPLTPSMSMTYTGFREAPTLRGFI